MAKEKVKKVPQKQQQKKKQLGSKMQKVKKKWFIVNAPAVFNNKEIGEIPANEPLSLIGRTLEVTYATLTGNRKDVFNKLLLKIDKVRGETAETTIKKFFVADSYIQTIHKKNKHRLMPVFEAKTKDGKNLKIKLYILAKNKLHRSLSSKMTHLSESIVKREFEKMTAENILGVEGPRTIANILKKELSILYPCRPLVWKIYNLSD